MKLGVASIMLGVALLAGCSGFPRRESDQVTLERYLDYAQPPVRSFSYLGRLDGWRPLGRNHVVVWTTPSKAYLLEVAGPCQELPFATRIGLTSTGSTVSTGFDSVRLRRGERCTITEIRPVDYSQMRADARASKRADESKDEAKRAETEPATKPE
jgi:hypothetical protein